MAIARNTVTQGTNDSSSFSITIAGSIVIGYFTFSSGSSINTVSLAGVSGTVLQTNNHTSDGYVVSCVSFVGTFSGSQAVSMTWTGGTPASRRSDFVSYDGSSLVDTSAKNLVVTSGSVSATVGSNCWVVGAAFTSVGAAAGKPATGTNNDGYAVAAGTTNGLLKRCIGDSNGIVSSGSQSVSSSTTGGLDLGLFLVSIYEKQVYTTSLAQGSFTLTGYAAALTKTIHYILTAAYGTFSLSGSVVSFTFRTYTRYINQVKNFINPTNSTKSSTITATNQTKNSSTWTNTTKH